MLCVSSYFDIELMHVIVIENENEEIVTLKKRVSNLDLEIIQLKSNKPSQTYDSNQKEIEVRKTRKSCSVCGETFGKNSDLEIHRMEIHEEQKQFKCEECNKEFILE